MDDELKVVWWGAEGATGLFGPLVRFLLLTGARRSEAAKMAWSEIADGEWTLPAARNKAKVELARPLSTAAQECSTTCPGSGRRATCSPVMASGRSQASVIPSAYSTRRAA